MFKKNLKYKILTPSGFENFDGIKKQYKETIKFIFHNNKIRVTKYHLFGNIKACTLNIGDYIESKNGKIKIIDIIKDNKFVEVYDPINVENNIYYGNNILNHNCEFLGSTSTVIEADDLKRLLNIDIDPSYLDLKECLRIYEKPEDGAKYILGVDVAKGVAGDYSTIQILRINSSEPIDVEQMAVYESNEIDPYNFAEIVNRLSLYYNSGYIIVENNSEGWTVVSELHFKYESECLVNTGNKIKDLGIRATPKSKQNAVILMKKLIESGSLKLKDKLTIKQLTDFSEKANGSFSCDNLHDDLVAALYWACYFFKMNILTDVLNFKKEDEDEDDAWGILKDIDPFSNENWDWMYN